MKKETELDINLVIASLREQIGVLALDKAMLTARLQELENTDDSAQDVNDRVTTLKDKRQ
jgi:hypothetical protein